MKDKKAVLYGKPVRCPACGTELAVGATVRLKATREIGQMQLNDPEPLDEGQEAGDGA